MIKPNRIGNKLGLVGLLGIALALGMAANQMMSESAVRLANQQADNQRLIAEHALDARVELRRLQIAERDIKSAVTPEETEKALRALGEAGSAATKAVDLALEKVAQPENAEWLQSVKSLLSDYFNGAKALGKTQLKNSRSRQEAQCVERRMGDTLKSAVGIPGAGAGSQPARHRARAGPGGLQLQRADGGVVAIRCDLRAGSETGDRRAHDGLH